MFPYDYWTEAARIETQVGGAYLKTQTIETNHYRECYLSNVGRTVNQGTVTIAETATIQVTAIEPVKWPGASPSHYGETEYESPNVFAGGALQ